MNHIYDRSQPPKWLVQSDRRSPKAPFCFCRTRLCATEFASPIVYEMAGFVCAAKRRSFTTYTCCNVVMFHVVFVLAQMQSFVSWWSIDAAAIEAIWQCRIKHLGVREYASNRLCDANNRLCDSINRSITIIWKIDWMVDYDRILMV